MMHPKFDRVVACIYQSIKAFCFRKQEVKEGCGMLSRKKKEINLERSLVVE